MQAFFHTVVVLLFTNAVLGDGKQALGGIAYVRVKLEDDLVPHNNLDEFNAEDFEFDPTTELANYNTLPVSANTPVLTLLLILLLLMCSLQPLPLFLGECIMILEMLMEWVFWSWPKSETFCFQVLFLQQLPLLKLPSSYLFWKVQWGQEKLEMLRDIARNKSSFHPSIVARVPKELLPNVVVARDNNEEEEFGIGRLTNPEQDLLTPLTKMMIGLVFENVGVTRVADAGMMTAKNSRGEPCTTAAPFHFVFIPIPSVDKKPSSMNNAGQREYNAAGIYNQNFWKNRVEYRSVAKGSVTSWLNMSVKVPECPFGMTQHTLHAEGLASLTNIGPVIGDDWMYMTLYGAYCHPFRFFMSSEVTICARAFGFRPIFLMTNTLVL